MNSTASRSFLLGLATAAGLWAMWMVLMPSASEPESLKVSWTAQNEGLPGWGSMSHLAAARAQWVTARLAGVGTGGPPRSGYATMRRIGATLVALSLVAVGGVAALSGASPGMTVLAVLATGGTWTVAAHALYPWETTWALPLMAAALVAAAVASRSGRRSWIAVAGILIVLAGLVYLVALLAVPAVGWLASSSLGPPRSRRRLAVWVTFCCAAGVLCYAAFTAAPWRHQPSLWGPFREFRVLGEQGLFGNPGLATAGGIPFGWANATVGLPDWRGVRQWISVGGSAAVLWRLILAVTTLGGAIVLLIRGLASRTRGNLAATGLFLLGFGMLAPYAWAAPTYLKLWIVGVFGLPFVVLVAEELPRREHLAVGACVVAIAATTIVTALIPRFRTADLTAGAAGWLARARPGALLIAAGWDGFSDEMAVFEQTPVLSLTQVALGPGVAKADRETTIRQVVARSITAACAAHRPVYLLGLTSITAAEWDSFLGSRIGVSFGLLEWLRTGATPDTTLSVLDPEGRARSVSVARVPCIEAY